MDRPVALSIAGSDSCGGAGIQADLKTFTAFGVYGATALTSVTVQNTSGVRASVDLEPEIVAGQIDAVLDELPVAAAKTGMLANAGIMRAVGGLLAARPIPFVVVDPVMVATSGSRLMQEDAHAALVGDILPRATLVTPNTEEAAVLAGFEVRDMETMERAARAIVRLGAGAVLIKGGHLTGDASDLLFDGTSVTTFSAERIPGGRLHGTGCTLSSAIAAGLALGWTLERSVDEAKGFVTAAIRGARRAEGAGGEGARLLDHLGAGDARREIR